jgi:leucyl/phenylalanyl-tRNA---protein transferase
MPPEPRPRSRFPHPSTASPDGIVAIGGRLTTETLQDAYRSGIFPWPHAGLPLLWFSPDPRAVLDFDRLHIPRRLVRRQRQGRLTFTHNQAFDAVIHACRRIPRRGEDNQGTWITAELEAAYRALHRAGGTLSVEAWDGGGVLVAGLYGVTAGGYFSGESMFTTVDDGSKSCVLHLIDLLRAQGHTWIDIQTMTPHFEMLGAHEIDRDAFLQRISN